MNSPADNTNTFPGPPTRSFDPSAESVLPVDAATSTLSAGHTPTPTPFHIDLPGHTCLMFLDKGGMGLVSLYHEHQYNRQVAVKLCPVRDDSPTLIYRFFREYETLRNLDHTKVVQVFNVDRIPGFVYYTMRYVPTGTLVRQEKAVRASVHSAAEFARKLAAAVEYVHQRNVLHRDIKPGNILVDEAGNPLLADFGLAWVDDGHTTTLGNAPFGTPGYMAPEVTLAGPGGCSARSDIWAVGVILYELLAGCRPFTGGRDDHAELYRSIRHDRPPPIRKSADALPDVDERLETICLKCLAKSPAHRYQSAGELADDLKLWLDGQPPTLGAQPDAPDVRSAAEHPADVAPTVTVVAPQPPGRWQPKVAAAALAAVLLTATVLAATLWPKQQPSSVSGPDRSAVPPLVKKSLIERLTKAGDSVTFVGETGKPVEEVGPLNGFVGQVAVGIGGRFELNTATIYFHELFHEDLPFPVRWEADVSVSTPVDQTRVGIYAMERGHPQPDGSTVHTAFFSCFGPGPRVAGKPHVSQFDQAIAAPGKFAVPDGTARANGESMFTPIPTAWKQILPPDPIDPTGQPGPFHHLTVEVNGGQIRAARDSTPSGESDRPAQFLRDVLQLRRVTVGSPTLGHGYGLFVVQGAGQYRNVRVTRLAE